MPSLSMVRRAALGGGDDAPALALQLDEGGGCDGLDLGHDEVGALAPRRRGGGRLPSSIEKTWERCATCIAGALG